MSTTIDQRVVEMRFDNKHFEQNVSTTMSTLDKFKQKLHLDGATKGLENVNSAAKKVDLSGLGSSADAVAVKFSHMQMSIQHQLNRIVDSAFNAGKRIVKSLTIDPIKSGFEEYETKMGSIQTILANTEHQGTTLDDVTAALDELNTYADKTIYNFQQMTKNIGTFTAAGVDLDTSVRSIQGIANLAAVSGSTSQQASTAMYQLSQALAAGTIKLMDWNSVVNAGMGGKVFQNALIRTAAMLDGAASDVEAWQAKNVDAYGSFRESLSQGAWLTADVLTTTLEQFTMAAEEGTEEWEAYKKSLMDQGYAEAQAEEILKMANTATDAATKVKTFTQLMDTLKESAQSGWAQTWEHVVGDFEEAKEFFTELSDLFGGIIGESANRRNNFLSSALSSNWDKLISKINEAGVETQAFEESIRKVVGDDKLDGLIEDYGSLEKAIRDGALSGDILKKALDTISGTGADSKLDNIVNGLKEIEHTLSRGSIGEDVKKLQTALDELGFDLGDPGVDGIIGPITEKAIKTFQEANGLIVDGIAGPQTLAALEEAASKIEKTTENVEDLKGSCGDLIDVIAEKSGRELLLDSLMNVIKAIQRPLSAVGEAFRDVFSISPEKLYGALKKINEFTERLKPKGILEAKTWDELTGIVDKFGIKTTSFVSRLTDTLSDHGVNVIDLIKKYGSLGKAFEDGAISFDVIKEALLSFDGITESLLNGGENVEKVRRTFEGLFALIETIAKILSGPLKFAFKIATGVLERLGLSVLDITANIGDRFVSLRDTVDKVIDTITTFIVDNVVVWIEKFKETEFFKTVAEWFEEASDTISTAVDNISQRISDFNASTFIERVSAIGTFFSDLASSIANSKIVRGIIDGAVSAFKGLKPFFAKFKLPEFNIDNLKTFFQDLVKIGENIPASGKGGFIGAITGFGKHIKDNIISWDWTVFKETALEKFVTFWLTTGDKIKSAFEKGKEVAQAIKRFIFGADEIDLPTILSVVEKFLGILVLIRALRLLENLTAPFDNITDALDNLSKSLKWDAIAGMFKAMAIAIGAFALCIIAIVNIGDMKKAWSAAGMLLAMIALMGGIAIAMGIVINKLDLGFDAAGAALSMLALIGAIVLLVYAIKEIDGLKLKSPVKTFLTLGAILVGMSMGVRAISKAGGSSFRSVAAILTMMAALKLLLEVVEDYDQFNWAGKGDAIMRVIGMLAILSLAINLSSRGIKENASAKGLAATILAMVISLKILVGVIEDFAGLSNEQLLRGGGAVVALLLAFTGIAVILSAVNQGNVLEKGQRVANNFTGLAVALLAVVAAVWLIGKMATNDLEATLWGFAGVITILGMFTLMLASIGKSCSGLKMGAVVTMLIGFGILVAELAFIVKDLSEIPWQNSLSSAGALAGLILTMTAAIRLLDKCNFVSMFESVFALALMTLPLLALTEVLRNMNGVDNAITNAGALAILAGAMSLVVLVLSKVKSVDIGMVGSIFTLLALTIPLFALTEVLRNMNGVENATTNAIALAILAGALSLCLIPISLAGKFAGAAIGGVIALAGLMVSLFIVVDVLSKMEGLQNARENAVTLAILAGALSLCMIPLALAGSLAHGALVGVIALAGLMAALHIVVSALAKMEGLQNARENAVTLAILTSALTLCMVPLTLVGVFAIGAVQGVMALAGLMTALFIVVAVLSKMEGLQNAKTNADILILLLTTVSDVLIKISLLAPLAIIGVTALTALISLIGTMGLVVAAIGILMGDHYDTISKFVDNGIQLFVKLAQGLGEIMSAFAVGLTSGLAEIGRNLSEFAIFALPFIALVSSIGDNVVSGATNLALAIGALLAADFISDIASIPIFANGSLGDLGNNLSEFAKNVGGFIAAMKDIDPETAAGVEALCSAIGTLTAASFWDGIGDKILGTDSLSGFGESISAFATCIKDSAIALQDITDEDVENIKKSAVAGQALADLNQAIPRQDGWLQDFLGSKDLATFGESAEAFADCLISYSEKVSGENIDTEAIKNSASAAQALVDVANALPSSGGVWQEWTGEKSLSQFGSTLNDFGTALVGYSGLVAGTEFDVEAVKSSASAASELAAVADALPAADGKWQEWTGEKSLATFGTQLITFAQGLLDYSNVAVQIDDEKIAAITKSGDAIDAINKIVEEKIPESGGWGDAIFGSTDAGSFGTGLIELANGIISYCDAAAIMGSEATISTIKNSGTAIDEINNVLSKVEDVVDIYKIDNFKNFAVDPLSDIAGILNNITVNESISSNIDSLKGAITKVTSVVRSIDADSYADEYTKLKGAVKSAKDCAMHLNMITGYSYEGVDSFKEAITTLGSVDVNSVVEAFNIADEMNIAIASLTNALVAGLKNAGIRVTDAVKNLITQTITNMQTKADEFRNAGVFMITKLVKGITSARSQALSAGSSVGGYVTTGVTTRYTGMYNAGLYLVDGFAAGITARTWKAEARAKAMANAAEKAAKEALDINSPSKVFRAIGYSVPEGFAMGIDRMSRMVTASSTGMASKAIDSVRSSISRIADVVNADIDSQPTIRPVLDLSDVRSGVGAIGSLFSGTKSIGVQANVSAISSMMNNRSQNGVASDVISAIDKLRKDLSNVGNTTYSINGVTYDDGSNIAEAVKTITRAAIRERRV